MRVLIAGGGTGGHVIPALAIARELRDKHGAEVRFVGTARGLETRLGPEGGVQAGTGAVRATEECEPGDAAADGDGSAAGCGGVCADSAGVQATGGHRRR